MRKIAKFAIYLIVVASIPVISLALWQRLTENFKTEVLAYDPTEGWDLWV